MAKVEPATLAHSKGETGNEEMLCRGCCRGRRSDLAEGRVAGHRIDQQLTVQRETCGGREKGVLVFESVYSDNYQVCMQHDDGPSCMDEFVMYCDLH